MNEELRFSWGHILAFLALIFIAYVTFMGITYFTLGNFVVAGIGAVACVIVLAAFLLGAQVKKGAPTKFYKSMIWERCLILFSPIVLILAFYPYNHFWSVLSQEDKIVDDFKTSISHAHGIFDEYESYAHHRINTLAISLSDVSQESRSNRVDELTLLLLSSNFNNLKSEANSWIDNAAQSSTVWNVFLLGNVDNIAEAVGKWNHNLNTVSSKHLICEKYEVEDFSPDCLAKQETINGLKNLKSRYSNTEFKFNLMSIITMIVCFLMLLCPYFIQERNAANCEKFWDFWIFSHFFNSEKDLESKEEYDYKLVVTPQKATTAKGQPENLNENQEIVKTIRKPKTSKGAPV